MKEKTTLRTLKTQEREARISLIINAAERVFATKPFDKASMREIAKEAGMAPSSIYRYFPNQEALFTEIVMRNQIRLNELISESISKGDPKSSIRKVVETFITFIAENDSYFRMMTILMSQGNFKRESSRKIIPVMGRSLDVLQEALDKTK
jgi:AcrR family transcriptional regulator